MSRIHQADLVATYGIVVNSAQCFVASVQLSYVWHDCINLHCLFKHFPTTNVVILNKNTRGYGNNQDTSLVLTTTSSPVHVLHLVAMYSRTHPLDFAPNDTIGLFAGRPKHSPTEVSRCRIEPAPRIPSGMTKTPAAVRYYQTLHCRPSSVVIIAPL